MTTRRALFAALLALAVCAQNASAGKREEPKEDDHLPKEYIYAGFQEARFSCRVPRDWRKVRSGIFNPTEKVYGIILLGPADRYKLSPTIAIYYYAPDNPDFADAGEYIAMHQEAAMWTKEGKILSKPKQVKIAGKPATSFSRDAFSYASGRSSDGRDIKKRDDFVVLPRDDGSFYALTYSASHYEHPRWLPVFDKVLQSFRPAEEERKK
ncbi:MAG: hypothetical protein ABIJ96_10655 [Elusimicrobiota bacterium]